MWGNHQFKSSLGLKVRPQQSEKSKQEMKRWRQGVAGHLNCFEWRFRWWLRECASGTRATQRLNELQPRHALADSSLYYSSVDLSRPPSHPVNRASSPALKLWELSGTACALLLGCHGLPLQGHRGRRRGYE